MTVAKVAKVLYVAEITEYERGWGCKNDGYMAFLNEAYADAFIAEQYKDRKGPAPDYYVSYDKVGYKPACDAKIAKALKKEYFYIDRIGDLEKE